MDIFAPVPNVRATTRSFACFLVCVRGERASAPARSGWPPKMLYCSGVGGRGECFEDCLKVLLC